MTFIINICLIIFVIKRVYWYNKYGTIRKKEVKAIKRQNKRNSAETAVDFYYGTAVEMVKELYPNAPLLEAMDYREITKNFVSQKDMKVADATTWDRVIGEFLREKKRKEALNS